MTCLFVFVMCNTYISHCPTCEIKLINLSCSCVQARENLNLSCEVPIKNRLSFDLLLYKFYIMFKWSSIWSTVVCYQYRTKIIYWPWILNTSRIRHKIVSKRRRIGHIKFQCLLSFTKTLKMFCSHEWCYINSICHCALCLIPFSEMTSMCC